MQRFAVRGENTLRCLTVTILSHTWNAGGKNRRGVRASLPESGDNDLLNHAMAQNKASAANGDNAGPPVSGVDNFEFDTRHNSHCGKVRLKFSPRVNSHYPNFSTGTDTFEQHVVSIKICFSLSKTDLSVKNNAFFRKVKLIM